MQDHAANQLHIEVAHAGRALRGFADDGKRFGQNFIERFVGDQAQRLLLFVGRIGGDVGLGDALFNLLAESRRVVTQLVVGKSLHLSFVLVDLLNYRPQALQ